MTDTFSADAWLQRFGSDVARIMQKTNGDAGRLLTRCCAFRDGRLVLHAQLGKTACAVKAFDLTQGAASAAFERELALLYQLNKSGLCPDLAGFNREHGFVVMDWIYGPTLKHTLTVSANRQSGEMLGVWYARYAALTHQSAAKTNWFDYLNAYDAFRCGPVSLDPALGQMPILNMGIAKNDGYLGNFLVTPDRGLIAIDFEAARLKPVGWDVLITARGLLDEFGEAAKPIIDGLVAGWCARADGFDQATFEPLLATFLNVLDGSATT